MVDLIQWRARIGSYHASYAPAMLKNETVCSPKTMQSMISGAALTLIGGGAMLFAVLSSFLTITLFVAMPTMPHDTAGLVYHQGE